MSSTTLNDAQKLIITGIIDTQYRDTSLPIRKYLHLIKNLADTHKLNIYAVSDFVKTLVTDVDDIIYFPKTAAKRTTKTTRPVKSVKTYNYPVESVTPVYHEEIEPHSTQWVHDTDQTDDTLDRETVKRAKKLTRLLKIKCPDQGTLEWFNLRHGKITASDGGCVVDVNHYEKPYKFLLKKTTEVAFNTNKFCHHGKKYEDIATMIYENRMNVCVKNFGLLAHKDCEILAASPDGIVGPYKRDGVHKTALVGRMLEIKCPMTRKINTTGNIFDICPEYYWVQVQLQLECCDLDECDFWQCRICEYKSRDDFIADTDSAEPFRSRKYGFEKGAVIQLLPHGRNLTTYDETVHAHSKYIYPPRIEMTPYEYDIWISTTLAELHDNSEFDGYYFDRIIYWRLERSHCLLIKRDREWFEKNLPLFEKMWKYVVQLREDKSKHELLLAYIASVNPAIDEDTRNEMVISTVEIICTGDTERVHQLIAENGSHVNDDIDNDCDDDCRTDRNTNSVYLF